MVLVKSTETRLSGHETHFVCSSCVVGQHSTLHIIVLSPVTACDKLLGETDRSFYCLVKITGMAGANTLLLGQSGVSEAQLGTTRRRMSTEAPTPRATVTRQTSQLLTLALKL